jgi:hypothetical protein
MKCSFTKIRRFQKGKARETPIPDKQRPKGNSTALKLEISELLA